MIITSKVIYNNKKIVFIDLNHDFYC